MPKDDAINGPWEADSKAPEEWLIWNDKGLEVCALQPDNYRHGWEDRLEQVAKLIGKAPEMKDALERAKFFCKGSKLGDKVRAEINQLLESLE